MARLTPLPDTTEQRRHPSGQTSSLWTDARAYLDRQQEAGATRKEAIRSLTPRLSDTITCAMLADTPAQEGHQLRAA